MKFEGQRAHAFKQSFRKAAVSLPQPVLNLRSDDLIHLRPNMGKALAIKKQIDQILEQKRISGDLTQLQVAASADSATIEKIHPGQMAVIEIPTVSATIEGKVREVKPDQVIIEFTRPNQGVRPGMTARAKIKLS